MKKVNVEEDREATIARFLNRLNKEINNIIELHHYVELEDMVSMAMKIKKQLKGKGGAKTFQNNTWTSKWYKKDEKSKEKFLKEKTRI